MSRLIIAAAFAFQLRAGLPVVFEPGVTPGEWIARIGTSAVRVTSAVVRFAPDAELRIAGARASQGAPERQLPGSSSYFIGTNRRQGVPHYARVRFSDIYQGIDIVYYGSDGRLEYDLVAAPGADLSRIKLNFAGRVNQTVEGDLRIVTKSGELLQRRPRVFEGGHELASRYRVHAGHIGIEIDGHRPDRALVIDPVIESATYLGGGSYEAARCIKLDSQGNVYLAGQAPAPGVFSGPFPSANNPGVDVALIKFSPQSNTIAYYVFLGGDQDDLVYALAVDGLGAAYVTGSTRSANFPVSNGFQMSPGGGGFPDAFVTKIAPDGKSIAYSSYLGGSGSDEAYAIAIDAAGAAYVGGTTGSRNFPVQTGAYQANFGGSILNQSATGFLAVISPTGSRINSSPLPAGEGEGPSRRVCQPNYIIRPPPSLVKPSIEGRSAAFPRRSSSSGPKWWKIASRGPGALSLDPSPSARERVDD